MPEMIPTAAQMRAWERAAIDAGETTGAALMERAGERSVDAILAAWPELAEGPRRAVVLCGPGNNGGDGFVVARLLRDRGWNVEVFLDGDAARLPPDARANHDRWTGPVGTLAELAARHVAVDEADRPFRPGTAEEPVFVDAAFGIGLARPVARALADVLSGARSVFARTVALDLPSGLDADTGRFREAEEARAAMPLRFAAPYGLTIAYERAKPGHLLADGPGACGRLRVVDLGLAALARAPATVRPRSDEGWTPPAVRATGARAAFAARKQGGHKYDHGHALVLAGPFGRTGAARLAARAALRMGAGLVTLAAPGGAMMECAAQLTAIMLRRADDADGLTALLEDDRLNALCLGPGLGTDDRAAGLVGAALAARRATVLDADALTVLSANPALLGRLHDRVVLTPHGGEFRRLAPDLADRMEGEAAPSPDPWAKMRAAASSGAGQGGGILARLQGGGPRPVPAPPSEPAPETAPAGPTGGYSKIDAARDAARRFGCTVLLKGPDTVIADPAGRATVSAAASDRAAPWLATAGTGDVLAGMVCGLLARGREPHDAAAAAAWLHVEAARLFGPGLIAEDLPDALPMALREAAGTERP